MSPRYLHLVRMDVAHDHEATFNDVYEHEHVPALLAVPGVGRATRYRNASPTDPRHIAAYEWVGSSKELTYRTPYIFWVLMDVEPHREALFNELYDGEHVPLLLKLPGSVNVVRYRTEAAGQPRYLAAYEVERADLPMSPAWNETSDIGRWKPEVRPYTYNKRYIVGERIWPRR